MREIGKIVTKSMWKYGGNGVKIGGKYCQKVREMWTKWERWDNIENIEKMWKK